MSTGNQLSVESLNQIRSSVSFFLQYDIPDLGFDITITRLFKYFYLKRPSFTKNVVTWDVGKVLKFLAYWHPIESLSLKQLTYKTVTLVAITSVDRAQTIHKLNVEKVSISAHGLEFVIPEILKTSKRGKPPQIVTCVSYSDERLDVCKYVEAYINKTLKFRVKAVRAKQEKPTQLFLSFSNGKPVLRATISRWIRETQKLAGINIQQYSAGTTRSASASAAFWQGASAPQIMKAGSWSNINTFNRFYKKSNENTPVGRLILQQASK